MLLVAGGRRDPNLHAVLGAARAAGVPVFPLLIGGGRRPSVAWSLEPGLVEVDGQRIRPTAVFARYDVFGDRRRASRQGALAWHDWLQGWLASSPGVRVLNRERLGRRTFKLHALALARQAGLRVPETLGTNDLGRVARLGRTRDTVAKPVAGGGYCRTVAELLRRTEDRDGAAACPAIVQERLRGPDIRVYVIGERTLAFRLLSRGLDYRAAGTAGIEPYDDLPGEVVESLRRLLAALGLEWGAADFRLTAPGGDPVFLEVNSEPMFSAFDAVVRGRISAGIVERLREGGAGSG